MNDIRSLAGALASLRQQGKVLEATYTGLVGLIVAVLRREKGWSQNQLAKQSEISQPTLSRIELGEADITVPQLDALARALDCRPGLFLDLADMLREMLRERQIEVAPKATGAKTAISRTGSGLPVSGALLTGGPVGFVIGTLLSTIILSDSKDRH